MLKKVLFCAFLIHQITDCRERFSFPDEYNNEDKLNNTYALEAEMDLLRQEPFIVVSLGENCFPALQFREHNIRIRSFPFDWDITPFNALYNILSNDFDGFINLENLAINVKENTVYNTKYRLKFNHDFDIHDWIDKQPGLQPKNNESYTKYQRVLSYYHRRISRFYAIFDLEVPIYLFRRVITSAQAKRLNNLLRSKFPRSNFTLVCIQDEKWEAPSAWQKMPPNIKYYRAPHPISHQLGQRNGLMTNILNDLELI